MYLFCFVASRVFSLVLIQQHKSWKIGTTSRGKAHGLLTLTRHRDICIPIQYSYFPSSSLLSIIPAPLPFIYPSTLASLSTLSLFFTFNSLRTVPFVKIYGQLKNIYVSYSSPRLVIPPFQISTASCPSATFPRGGRPTTRPSPCPPPRPTQRRNPAASPPSCAAFALRRHFCQRGA